jgi:HAD superfamily hydrolase (TIGR01509 family)
MQAVIFDFDGLIIDSELVIARGFIEVLAARGFTLSLDQMAHLFGSTEVDHLWDELIADCTAGAVTIDDLGPELGRTIPAMIDGLPLLPGVLEVLDAANATGRRVGLATGQEPGRLREHLHRHGLIGRFDVIVTSSEVARGKPAPDIFVETAHRLSVPPAQCLVLEDSLHGCEAAIAAGMAVVVCPSPVTAHSEFPACAARVDTLLELLHHPSWLGAGAHS